MLPILKAILEKGGKATEGEVFEIIEQEMKNRFNNLDIEVLKDGYTKRWQKNVAFARYDMVHKEGSLRSDSPRGLWEISEKGRKFIESI